MRLNPRKPAVVACGLCVVGKLRRIIGRDREPVEAVPAEDHRFIRHEAVLRIGDDDPCGRIVLCAPFGHERGAFVRTGRTAVRIGRRNEEERAAAAHRLKLIGKELRLRTCDPAARDSGGRQIRAVARQSIVEKLDARRNDELVVGITACFADHGLSVGIKTDDRVANDLDAVALVKRVV